MKRLRLKRGYVPKALKGMRLVRVYGAGGQRLDVGYDKQGYLNMVKNPKGTKESVYIAQTGEAGFSAFGVKSQKGYGRMMSAEKLAFYLADKGHKFVEFRT